MKNEQRLQPVAKIAKTQERNAAREMGEMQKQAQAQKTQLDMLLSYRDEYFQSFTSASRVGLSAVQMRDYQLFLKRLDTAIVQQRQQFEQSQQSCEQSQSHWRGKHNHTEMINKIIEKRKLQSLQIKNKKEQKEMDDCSSVSFFEKNTTNA